MTRGACCTVPSGSAHAPQHHRAESGPRGLEAPSARGRRVLFHVSSLPARAFDALIARILDLPELEAETDELFALPVSPAPEPLPGCLPAGVALPNVEDAAKMLVKLKLIRGN